MIEVLNAEQDHILEIKVYDKLSEEDLDHLVPVLKDHIEENAEPFLLLVMEQFKGWSDSAAFWKDLKLDTKFAGKFDRIAVAGDAKWEKWGTQIFSPIVSGEIKYVDMRELTDARSWLQK